METALRKIPHDVQGLQPPNVSCMLAQNRVSFHGNGMRHSHQLVHLFLLRAVSSLAFVYGSGIMDVSNATYPWGTAERSRCRE